MVDLTRSPGSLYQVAAVYVKYIIENYPSMTDLNMRRQGVKKKSNT